MWFCLLVGLLWAWCVVDCVDQTFGLWFELLVILLTWVLTLLTILLWVGLCVVFDGLFYLLMYGRFTWWVGCLWVAFRLALVVINVGLLCFGCLCLLCNFLTCLLSCCLGGMFDYCIYLCFDLLGLMWSLDLLVDRSSWWVWVLWFLWEFYLLCFTFEWVCWGCCFSCWDFDLSLVLDWSDFYAICVCGVFNFGFSLVTWLVLIFLCWVWCSTEILGFSWILRVLLLLSDLLWYTSIFRFRADWFWILRLEFPGLWVFWDFVFWVLVFCCLTLISCFGCLDGTLDFVLVWVYIWVCVFGLDFWVWEQF